MPHINANQFLMKVYQNSSPFNTQCKFTKVLHLISTRKILSKLNSSIDAERYFQSKIILIN